MMKKSLLFGWILVALLCAVVPATAQDNSEETVRISTRVVFIDALVQDKQTGEPVRNLTAEDFEVLDEGKPRTLTYFSREADARRRPLALLLLLDLEDFGAGKYLQQPGVIKSLTETLTKLRPEDEVAIVGDFFGLESEMLSGFTRDRMQTAAALAKVPDLVARGYGTQKNEDEKKNENLHVALEQVARTASAARPNSQVVIVHITDAQILIFNKDRSRIASNLNRSGATYNAITSETEKMFRVMASIFKPVAILARASFTGSAGYLARRTGGEALRVSDPRNYATTLENIINKLSARYSLGFTLDERERADGQMRRLEVRLRRAARDRLGKARKLTISARDGYFVPEYAAARANK
ncbi:MAG: VWA domain-containing protein [Pyrinomonadaceae bacterium]|nr:VWA domain-containing protein [Pyrinomonadaceae bacterium]